MAPPAITGATIYWAVTDLKGVQSSREKMTISIVKPMAKNFLLGQSVGAGKIVGANVLDDSFSQFPKDPSIVVLLGLVDIGRDDAPGGAFLRDDGKALHVPGEGSWLVDDTGMIAFQAEPAFDDAPTPVSYRFSDSKGNHSTPALILFDPALADIPPFLKALATQTDDDFWRAFRKHAVDDPKISLTAAEMVTVTQTYVLALRQLVPTELICPVSDAEYAKGYAQWDTGGQGNSDLLDVCIDLAGAATKTNSQPLAARYWGLTLMVRMLVQAGI